MAMPCCPGLCRGDLTNFKSRVVFFSTNNVSHLLWCLILQYLMLCCTALTWRMSDHMFATYTRRGRYTSCCGDEMTIWFTTKDVNCDDGRAALPLEFIHWTHHLCHLTVKGGQVTRTSLIHDDNEWTSVDDWRCYWREGLRSVHQVSLSGGQSLIMCGALQIQIQIQVQIQMQM